MAKHVQTCYEVNIFHAPSLTPNHQRTTYEIIHRNLLSYLLVPFLIIDSANYDIRFSHNQWYFLKNFQILALLLRRSYVLVLQSSLTCKMTLSPIVLNQSRKQKSVVAMAVDVVLGPETAPVKAKCMATRRL